MAQSIAPACFVKVAIAEETSPVHIRTRTRAPQLLLSHDQSTQNRPRAEGTYRSFFLKGHSRCDDRIYIFTNSPEYILVCMIVVGSRDTDVHVKNYRFAIPSVVRSLVTPDMSTTTGQAFLSWRRNRVPSWFVGREKCAGASKPGSNAARETQWR